MNASCYLRHFFLYLYPVIHFSLPLHGQLSEFVIPTLLALLLRSGVIIIFLTLPLPYLVLERVVVGLAVLLVDVVAAEELGAAGARDEGGVEQEDVVSEGKMVC